VDIVGDQGFREHVAFRFVELLDHHGGIVAEELADFSLPSLPWFVHLDEGTVEVEREMLEHEGVEGHLTSFISQPRVLLDKQLDETFVLVVAMVQLLHLLLHLTTAGDFVHLCEK
jgi:hypothetical protein